MGKLERKVRAWKMVVNRRERPSSGMEGARTSLSIDTHLVVPASKRPPGCATGRQADERAWRANGKLPSERTIGRQSARCLGHEQRGFVAP